MAKQTNKTSKVDTPKVSKNKKGLSWHEVAAGYISVLLLAVGTLRAVMLEAERSGQTFTVGLGLIVVAFGLQAVWKLLNRK